MEIDATKLSLHEIDAQLQKATTELSIIKATQKDLMAELDRRYSERATLSLIDNVGGFGTANIYDNGYEVKAIAGKRITYDNDMLQKLAGSLPWEEAQRLFKIKFDIPETTYKGIIDTDLLAKIDKARTVVPTPMKFTVSPIS